MQVSELLNKAADILERRGLCRFTPTDGNMLCMNSALVEATGKVVRSGYDMAGRSPLLDDARRRILASYEKYYLGADAIGMVCHINNQDDTTTESAVALMRKAARHAEVSDAG